MRQALIGASAALLPGAAPLHPKAPRPPLAPASLSPRSGGGDVWMDIGNKLYGLDAMERYLGAKPSEVSCAWSQAGGVGGVVTSGPTPMRVAKG